MTVMTGLTGTATSPQIMTISKKEFQPCVTNRIFLMHTNSPSCQKGVAKRDTLWTQIRYAIGAKNNPQHRPSNTEGCYSLLVSNKFCCFEGVANRENAWKFNIFCGVGICQNTTVSNKVLKNESMCCRHENRLDDVDIPVISEPVTAETTYGPRKTAWPLGRTVLWGKMVTCHC